MMTLNFLKNKNSTGGNGIYQRPSMLIHDNIKHQKIRNSKNFDENARLFYANKQIQETSLKWEKAKTRINNLVSEISSGWTDSIEQQSCSQNEQNSRSVSAENHDEIISTLLSNKTRRTNVNANNPSQKKTLLTNKYKADSLPLDIQELQNISSIARRLKKSTK